MKMLLAGEWVDREKKIEVKNPFNGEIIDRVPSATSKDIDKAVQSAQIGLNEIGHLSSYERYEILLQTATLIKERKDKLAKTIALESGKKISEANSEVDRATGEGNRNQLVESSSYNPTSGDDEG